MIEIQTITSVWFREWGDKSDLVADFTGQIDEKNEHVQAEQTQTHGGSRLLIVFLNKQSINSYLVVFGILESWSWYDKSSKEAIVA